MEPDELCLSDVHVDIEHSKPKADDHRFPADYEYAETSFSFKCPVFEAVNDEDGDICFRRSTANCCLKIEHALATRLRDVGLQVWPASLVLSDYILHNAALLRDTAILDLGTGVGLTSIIAGHVSRIVFATDIGENVLSLLKDNVKQNVKPGMDIRPRWLDWRKYIEQQEFSFQPGDIGLIKNECTHILAADVIYDLNATSALFQLLDSLQQNCLPKTVWIALERRLNFTLDDLEISCPAYNHFLQCLEKRNHLLSYKRIPLSAFSQYLSYNRNEYMELWEISLFSKQ